MRKLALLVVATILSSSLFAAEPKETRSVYIGKDGKPKWNIRCKDEDYGVLIRLLRVEAASFSVELVELEEAGGGRDPGSLPKRLSTNPPVLKDGDSTEKLWGSIDAFIKGEQRRFNEIKEPTPNQKFTFNQNMKFMMFDIINFVDKQCMKYKMGMDIETADFGEPKVHAPPAKSAEHAK